MAKRDSRQVIRWNQRFLHSKPTARQLAYLKALAPRTGQTFTYPKTIADARAKISSRKTAPPSSRAERHIERKFIADQIHAGEMYWDGMRRLAQQVNWDLLADGDRGGWRAPATRSVTDAST